MMLPLIRLKVSHSGCHFGARADVQVETTDVKEMTNLYASDKISWVVSQTLETFCSTTAERSQVARASLSRNKSETPVDLSAESTNMPDLPDEEIDDWEGEDPTAMTANDKLSKLRMANLVHQYLQAQQWKCLSRMDSRTQ